MQHIPLLVAICEMKIIKRKIFVLVLLILIGCVIYHFIFGRLMPFSPLVIGFEKHQTENSIVFFHNNEKELNYNSVDSLILNAEQFHKLKFNKKVRIFICKTDNEYKRYTGASSRMVTIFGNAIFISGMANAERKSNTTSTNIYLLHELSHLLIYQNTTVQIAVNYPNWFLEGIAVYSSNQFGVDGYLTKREVQQEIKKRNFVHPMDYGTFLSSKGNSVINCNVPNKYRFIYAEFGTIIGDLINTYGQEIFINFLHQSLKTDDFYTTFKKEYQLEFSEYVTEFEKRIKATNNVFEK